MVKQGSEVRLKCFSTGNPTPSVFWNRDLNFISSADFESNDLDTQLATHLLFSGKSAGKMMVTKEGTFVLHNVQKEDEGELRFIPILTTFNQTNENFIFYFVMIR